MRTGLSAPLRVASGAGRERKSAKGRGGGEESERGFGVRCLGRERASEWCACPFAWTPQFLVLWGCAGGGALGACKVCVCEKAAISFCVQK